jgi:predicted phage-related endonuclease
MYDEEFYPVTGESDEHPKLLASFDGLDMGETIIFEHKLWNEGLAAEITKIGVPASHYWQLEQQLLVSGAEKAVFVVSDGTEDNFAHVEYSSDPVRRAALVSGWDQFEKDLADYVPVAKAEKVEGSAVRELPQPSYTMKGTALTTNIIDFASGVERILELANKKPENDQDFANLEKLIKVIKKGEEAGKKSIENVQNEVVDISVYSKDMSYQVELLRQTRLAAEKMIKAAKEAKKAAIFTNAKEAMDKQIQAVNAQLSPMSLPPINADFMTAAKGKKTPDSIQSAVNDELARAKIEIAKWKDIIGDNKACYDTLTKGEYGFLFSDIQSLVTTPNEAFEALVQGRINQHIDRETQKQEKQTVVSAPAITEEPYDSRPQETQAPINPVTPVNMAVENCSDCDALEQLFGEEAIGALKFDSQGNEYELELSVSRGNLKMKAA